MKTENESGGVKFADLLLILFIGLKLAGVINWPWIWVLAPMWIPLAIWVVTVLAMVIARKRRKGEMKK
jgi:uncharacterized protein (DUF983 family)